MRKLIILAMTVGAVALAAGPPPPAVDAALKEIKALYGSVPAFARGIPPEGLPAAWDELKALEMSNTTLPTKTKELISVAVAAQIPCRYCVYADTQLAKAAGATDPEVREAIMVAAITRHWSTVATTSQLDPAAFDLEIAGIMRYLQTSANGRPIELAEPITDAASAYKDIEHTFGTVPMWVRAFPQSAIAPAWRELKDVELSPTTQIDNKTKHLIALAVAAQIPCRYSVSFHSAAAKLEGADDDELKEAVAIAALTRELGTVIQGALPDEGQFRREVDMFVKNMRAKEQMAKAAAQR